MLFLRERGSNDHDCVPFVSFREKTTSRRFAAKRRGKILARKLRENAPIVEIWMSGNDT